MIAVRAARKSLPGAGLALAAGLALIGLSVWSGAEQRHVAAVAVGTSAGLVMGTAGLWAYHAVRLWLAGGDPSFD